MAFTVPTFEQIRDRYLQALVNQRPAAAIGVDSDNYVRASAFAAVAEGLYAHQAWGFRQAFPDLADADYMEKMANYRGVQRKAAIAAAGTVRFTGTEGTNVPAGQLVYTAQGVYVSTTEAVLIAEGGTVDVGAQASVPGAGGNLGANTPATVSSPPANIGANATILTMIGGTDLESDAELLARLLLLLSEEAQGGNAVDYKRWALEVAGITRAFVFDARRGSGTVDVVPLTDAGLPSTVQLEAVQAIIEERRPVGMRARYGVLALAPDALLQSVAASLVLADGYELADLQVQLEEAVDSVFRALGPGETLVRSKLIAALMNVPGVTDVTLVEPAANVTSSVDEEALELIVRGALTLS
jgi:uncharacterized phage protein gp47/JayE